MKIYNNTIFIWVVMIITCSCISEEEIARIKKQEKKIEDNIRILKESNYVNERAKLMDQTSNQEVPDAIMKYIGKKQEKKDQ